MTSAMQDLIDLDTFVSLRKAAPKVSEMPWDAAKAVAQALCEFSGYEESHEDLDGRKYWEGSLKEIHEAGALGEKFPLMTVGKVCRLIGLVMFRRGDGYHAAWSEEQLAILRRYFEK